MAISTATSASQERLTPEEKNLFQESTKRINAIANDLLEKFRSGFDGTNNDQDGLEIGQQTKQLLGIYEQTWPEIEFKSIISEKQFFCTLPPTDFDRALSNILNNSTEALKGKGEIRVTIIEDAQHIEIHVCDNGPGIDPKIENRIFETGFTQNKAGGTGLGLAQAQDVFRSGGGDLKLIASDKGACFAASIPKSSAPQKLKVSREVFLAEDDPQIIELWKTKLQPLGCEVRAFTSPQDCLAAISLSKAKFQWTLICDLIFDDHELTGFDIFAEAKKQFSSPKPYRPDLILCTSLAENKEIRKIALSYGAKLIAKRHLKELSITLKI